MQCVIKTHYKYDKHKGYHPEVTFKVPKLNLMRKPKVIHRHCHFWNPTMKGFYTSAFSFYTSQLPRFLGLCWKQCLICKFTQEHHYCLFVLFFKAWLFQFQPWHSSTEVTSSVRWGIRGKHPTLTLQQTHREQGMLWEAWVSPGGKSYQ